MNEAWHKDVALFNDGQFQGALDEMTAHARAASERQFDTLLKDEAA